MKPRHDRRASDRIKIDGRKRIRIDSAHGNVIALLQDLTPTSAQFRTSKRFPKKAIVKIAFNPNSQVPLYLVKAKIMWAKPSSGGELFPNGKTWDYGVLFFQSKIDSSQLVHEFPEEPADRRKGSRRAKESTVATDSRIRDRRASNPFIDKMNRLGKSFDKWTTYHTYLRPVDSVNYPWATVHGQKKLMLGSNCYSGLATHPRVKEAAIKAIEKYGVGSGGVPVLSGTTDLHDELCATVARFKGTEDAILYPSGYIANFTCISTLFDKSDVIYNDIRNHASIFDGCRMSEAEKYTFGHNDTEDLENRLKKQPIERNKVVIVDGVFSMDGDLCHLPEVYRIARKYNALIMVDDAHSTGVIGPNGKGTAHHFGLAGKIDLTTVTLSKAIGTVGGVICGPRNIIKALVHLSRSYIFSSSLPPPICAAAIESFKLLEQDPTIAEAVLRNAKNLRNGLVDLGYNVAPTDSAVIPVIIGNESKTYELAHALDELGVFVNAVSRPAVKRESSRLRVSPSSLVTDLDIQFALDAFRKAGKTVGLI